jgi:hypothetical protein
MSPEACNYSWATETVIFVLQCSQKDEVHHLSSSGYTNTYQVQEPYVIVEAAGQEWTTLVVTRWSKGLMG